MLLVVLPPALLIAFGFLSFLTGRLSRVSHMVGAMGAVAASITGLALSIAALAQGQTYTIALQWNTVIGASFTAGFDPLTGLFLIPIYGLSAVCALFGAGYLAHLRGTRGLGSQWLFYGLLVASMALVVMARNAVLFLIAWELMSLSSWLLVTFESEREDAREAGITYLVATQIGTAFLLVMFLVLGGAQSAGYGGAQSAGYGGAALDFARFTLTPGPAAGVVFLLALVGFGTKAGIVPLHTWLPEAHPAAPSHVSALMSGVMIKTGIYGILRVLSLLGAPPAWWGWTLACVGAVSGIVGVLFALAQHDIKRLLAYHSVENIGIICLGIGVGLLGVSYGSPLVAVLGFAGGLLHVINHALFKGLLFLGAGAAAKAAGTREMDRLGGLLKKMPLTGAAFLIGAAAICGLPPLNGFVSELLVFTGAFKAVSLQPVPHAAAAAVVVAALALVGGLAAACFTKAFGIVFLGEPRTSAAAGAREAGLSLLVPMLLLAAGCAAVGLLGSIAVWTIAPLAAQLAGLPSSAGRDLLEPMSAGLRTMLEVAGVCAGVVAVLVLLRALLLRRRKVAREVTWDCGYVKPDARMQYTSSSFAQPLTEMFRGLLSTRRHGVPVARLFPAESTFSTETPDVFSVRILRPGIKGVGAILSSLRWLQHGRLQLYVLYIAVALVALLIWRLA
jgi:hydrogenase-4 component B